MTALNARPPAPWWAHYAFAIVIFSIAALVGAKYPPARAWLMEAAAVSAKADVPAPVEVQPVDAGTP